MDKGDYSGSGTGRYAFRASGGAFPLILYFHPASGGACPRADSIQIFRRIEILRNGARERCARAFENTRELQRRIELEPGSYAFAGHRGKTAENISSTIHRAEDWDSALAALDEYSAGYKYSPYLLDLKETLAEAFQDKTVSEKFGLVADYYLPFLKDKFDEWPNRLNDLEAIRPIADNYTDLNDLLADLAIEIPEENQKGKDSEKDEEKPLLFPPFTRRKAWNGMRCIFSE